MVSFLWSHDFFSFTEMRRCQSQRVGGQRDFEDFFALLKNGHFFFPKMSIFENPEKLFTFSLTF